MDGVSKVARIGQVIIGLVYLAAGAIKVWEPVLFYWESIPYTQILGIGGDSWEQATAAAGLLPQNLSLLISSPLRRCVQTTAAALTALGAPPPAAA